MEKLIGLGFENAAVANWRNPPSCDAISIGIQKYEAATNILYAVVFHSAENEDYIPVKSEVVYIGHTRRTFRNRLNGYQAGGGQAVNNRVNEAIKNQLSVGGSVCIMVLPDRHGLQMQGIHVDIAAGLEYDLIDYYCRYNRDHGHRVLINIAGNNCHNAVDQQILEDASEEAQLEFQEENADYPETPQSRVDQVLPLGPGDDCRSFTFEFTERTYWPLPVFNVPVRCQHCFGPHGDIVQVELVGLNPAHLEVPVDRNANQGTHAPRIYFGGSNTEVYDQWKCGNHAVGENVTVEIVGRNRIRLT